MDHLMIPRPRPPVTRPAPGPATAAPSVTVLDVRARQVVLEPGLWVWSVFDGQDTHTTHGFGDGTQIADWIRERWTGPVLLRGPNTEKICATMPDAAADSTQVSPHEMDQMMRREEVAAVRALPRLQVATDGACANGFVGSGWVATDGRHGAFGDARRGSRQVNASRAEFHAVTCAVANLHPDRRVELLIDATTVADDVRRAVAGEQIRFGSKMAGRTVCALAGRDVRVTWVQGHSGHALNEAADRLAVYGRRCAEAGADTSDDVMAAIVTEAGLVPMPAAERPARMVATA